MEDLTLYEIIKACDGSFGYPATDIISSICTDTRKIKPSCVFICIKGENFDGHDFAAKACELGAVAVISEKPIDGVRCIIVDSTRKAFLDIAHYYRQRFNIVLAGITGSVGKTTTKEMVALVLSQKFNTLKTEGNLNNDIGLPHTLLRLSKEYQAAVIEMGMSNAGEISVLSQTCRPTIAIITNVGVSHIENLGSREGILKAKLEILDGVSHNAPLILNGDNDMLCNLKDTINRDIIYYGIENDNVDVKATDIKVENGVTTFCINYWGKTIDAKLNCVGNHNVLDSLAAFCVGMLNDIKEADIVEGLVKFLPEGLRQSIVKKGEQTVIIDCYNASPDSMRASLAVLSELKPLPNGRRIAVLGDMFELGDMSKQLHSDVGGYAAASKADVLVCYGEHSQYIAQQAISDGMKNVLHKNSREEVVDFLKQELKPNDLVLFKASRGMKLEEVIDQLYK